MSSFLGSTSIFLVPTVEVDIPACSVEWNPPISASMPDKLISIVTPPADVTISLLFPETHLLTLAGRVLTIMFSKDSFTLNKTIEGRFTVDPTAAMFTNKGSWLNSSNKLRNYSERDWLLTYQRFSPPPPPKMNFLINDISWWLSFYQRFKNWPFSHLHKLVQIALTKIAQFFG